MGGQCIPCGQKSVNMTKKIQVQPVVNSIQSVKPVVKPVQTISRALLNRKPIINK